MAFILLAASYTPTVIQAAQPKVSVNSAVFFTLDNVVLTATTGAQAMSFTLNLTNQSAQAVDFNQYGIRVKDKDGNKYAAQLTEKASARVLSKQTQGFKYATTVPSNININQLSIEIFVWDYSLSSMMRTLGSLDAAVAVVKTTAPVNKKVTINLSALDAKLPKNSSAAFSLLSSYKVLKNGAWMVYSDIVAENLGAASVKIPDNLLFNLRDESELYLLTSLVAGQNLTLAAKQRKIFTLQTPLKDTAITKGLTLELRKRPLTVGSAGTVLASFPMDATFVDSHIGTYIIPPTLASNALTLVAESATYTHNTFNNVIDVEVTVNNVGKSTVPLPLLSSYFQVIDSDFFVTAIDKEKHPVTLAPNESSTYHFTGTFPLATDESMIQLVINTNKSTTQTVSKPINVVTLSSSNMSYGTVGTTEVTSLDLKEFDATLASHSMLNFQVLRSYHSVSDGEPTMNIEVNAENATAVALKLPAALLLELRDSAQLSYPTTIINGSDQTIVPHQSIQFTLQVKTGTKDKQTAYSLDFIKKAVVATETNTLADSIDISSSFANTQAVNSAINTDIGKLGLSVISTYRLATSSGDDILMSEVQLQNLDSKTITIPNKTSFYGGYMLQDLDAGGQIIQMQSSPYLYPGQKTTLYIYTKIPYTSVVDSGYIYIGNGILNSQTSAWTDTHEWSEIPFTLAVSTLTPIVLDKEWILTDPGRSSTGKIVDSQIYEINNQKLLATRILQTSKELRNGSIVPYTGYLSNADGSVISLKTTDDIAAGPSLCNQCSELSTLWTVLPLGFSTAKPNLVFGQKLDDQAFASPLQYTFTPETVLEGSGTTLNSATVYPFRISVQNAKLTQTSTGSGQNTSIGYEINFDYTITKLLDAAGAVKNRSLVFTLTEEDGQVIKTWDAILDGTDAWVTGENKLSFTNTDIPDLQSFLNLRQLNVYEKFEGGTRLLGTIAVKLF